jgi:hypothetical protein
MQFDFDRNGAGLRTWQVLVIWASYWKLMRSHKRAIHADDGDLNFGLQSTAQAEEARLRQKRNKTMYERTRYWLNYDIGERQSASLPVRWVA